MPGGYTRSTREEKYNDDDTKIQTGDEVPKSSLLNAPKCTSKRKVATRLVLELLFNGSKTYSERAHDMG